MDKKPTPIVGTAGGEPVPVELSDPALAAPIQAQTAQESETTLRTEGQRRVNLIWEITQAIIAVAVTVATLFIAGKLALSGAGDMAAFVLLSNVCLLVMATYFQRTNHQKVGGVGKDDGGR